MFDAREFRCHFISKVDINRKADTAREQFWGKNELPVDIDLVIEKAGLNIIPLILPDKYDAYLKSDLTGIVINKRRSEDPRYEGRLRFSLAHEFGHYILHADLIKTIGFQSIEEYVDFFTTIPEEQYDYFEYQANAFGGRLLVPYPALCIEVNKAIKTIQEYGIDYKIREDPDGVLASICPQLCKSFYVSQQCIEWRVRNEKLWPPEEYR